MGEIARRMAQDDKFLFETLIFPHLRESYDDLLAASLGAEAVISHSLAFSARLVAETRGLPIATVLLSPLMLYSAYDPPLGSRAPIRRAPAWPVEVTYNRFLLWSLSHAVALWAAPLRRMRRDLGLRPRYGLDLLLGVKSSAATIGLFSPMLAPPQPDHGSRTLIAGFAFHDRSTGAEKLAEEFEDFLAAGTAPIAFSLGSIVARDQGRFYREGAVAARRLGRRAVLLVHEDDVAELKRDLAGEEDIHVSAYAPHSLVFPRACAVVHHGGVGTTGQALRAGRPQLVAPFFADQFDNAERVARLGVGGICKGAAATAETLGRELARLLDDRRIAARAEAAASEVVREDGALVAARRIAALPGLRRAQEEVVP